MEGIKGVFFIGPMGSGKTTAAKMLEKMYPNVRRYSLAAPLKEIAQEIWGRNVSRQHYQKLGTDIVREIDKDTWIDVLVRRIYADRKLHPDIVPVIDDVRFPNEWFHFAVVNEYVPVRIDVQDSTRRARLWERDSDECDDYISEHESEYWSTKLPGLVLDNEDGGMSNLRAELTWLVKDMEAYSDSSFIRKGFIAAMSAIVPDPDEW